MVSDRHFEPNISLKAAALLMSTRFGQRFGGDVRPLDSHEAAVWSDRELDDLVRFAVVELDLRIEDSELPAGADQLVVSRDVKVDGLEIVAVEPCSLGTTVGQSFGCLALAGGKREIGRVHYVSPLLRLEGTIFTMLESLRCSLQSSRSVDFVSLEGQDLVLSPAKPAALALHEVPSGDVFVTQHQLQ